MGFIAEIDRITDRDAQLVENRVRELRKILAEAERRVGVFSQELEGRQRRDALYAELGAKHKNSPSELSNPPAEKRSETAADRALEKAPEKLTDKTAERTAKIVEEKPEGKKELSRLDEVLLLNASGLTSAQIAAKLDMTVTEVEMSLVLRQTAKPIENANSIKSLF